MDLQLKGKAFLITGGSSGLGKALAGQLVSEGARVAILARNPEPLAEVAGSLRDAGGEVLDVPGDARSAQDLERFVESAMARWGQIDGVVNNAGELAADRSPSMLTPFGKKTSH